MSRRTLYLNPTTPQAAVSLQWQAVTVEVNNPTGSAILARIGGNDYPTRDSANLVIPPLKLYQAPARGHDFGFTFDNPAAVGTLVYPYKNVIINLLSADEFVGNIGDANQLAIPQGTKTMVNRVESNNAWVSLGAISLTQAAIIGYVLDFIQAGATPAGTAPIIDVIVNQLGGGLGTLGQHIYNGQGALPYSRTFGPFRPEDGIPLPAGGPVLAFLSNADCVLCATIYWVPLL